MPQRSSYKPEISRKGTELATNQRNIEQIFAILNRHEERLDNIEQSLNYFINVTFPLKIAEAKNFGLMMLDVE